MSLADAEVVTLLSLLSSNRGLDRLLLDNGSLLGRVTRKFVVLLDHCNMNVLVLGGSALELHDTVGDDGEDPEEAEENTDATS